MGWKFASSFLGFVALFALLACGGGGGGDGPAPAPSREYVGTQSPGDLWSWTLDPLDTWEATNETLAFDYSGTYESLPSGFLKFIVTGSTEPGMVLPAVAYGLEMPNTALLVKPDGPDENLICMVAAGSCPVGPTRILNWVEMTDAFWNPLTDTAYGIATATITGANMDIENDRWLLDGTPLPPESLTGFTCASGIITDPTTPAAAIVMAPTGVFISDSGPGEGGVIGMDAPAVDIDLADLVLAGREYRGTHFKDQTTSGDDSRAVWARPGGPGDLTGGEYIDIETNVERTTSLATIVFVDQPSPGIVNGTLEDDAGTSDIVFLINQLGGRYFIYGISVDTNDGKPYNFLVIEQ
ncbi:MAG: hypothetical protein ACYTG6_00580 [Planctomycetota bacterium]|jgi:hypothetical protein